MKKIKPRIVKKNARRNIQEKQSSRISVQSSEIVGFKSKTIKPVEAIESKDNYLLNELAVLKSQLNEVKQKYHHVVESYSATQQEMISIKHGKQKALTATNDNSSVLDDFEIEIKRLKVQNIKNKAQIESLRNSISFQLGNCILQLIKSPGKTWLIIKDIYKLSIEAKRRRNNDGSKSIQFTPWDLFILRDKPVSTSVKVEPEQTYMLRGTIQSLEGEKNNAALISFNFLGFDLTKGNSTTLGLSKSATLGLYKYLPTKVGSKSFEFEFRTPKDATYVELNARRWFSNSDIRLSGSVDLVKKCAKNHKKSINHENLIIKLKNKNSTAALQLLGKQKTLTATERSEIVATLICRLDHQSRTEIETYVNWMIKFGSVSHVGEKTVQHLISCGLFTVAYNLASSSSTKQSLPNEQLLQLYAMNNCIKNGVAISPRTVPAYLPKSNSGFYFLHCSMAYHSNGYATRGHSILTALKGSEYSLRACTRVGYPWDVRFASAPGTELANFVGDIEYHSLPGLASRSTPMEEYFEQAALKIESELLTHKPAFVHACSNYMTAIPALIAARRVGIPFIYEVRGFWEITEASNKPGWEVSDKYQLDEKMESQVALASDAVITLTNAMKQKLITRGVSAKKLFVSPNGVNIEQFNPVLPDVELKSDIGLKHKLTIGYVGSIVDYEGLDDLLTATKKLQNKGLKFNLLIVGDGSALPRLKEIVADLNIDDVHFTGRVPHDDVIKYYSIIDIAPFPRKAIRVCELVSPLKPFEAMALHKAVIASNVNAIAEFIDDGHNGLLFNKGCTDSLAECLERVITDVELRKKLAENSRKWVCENRTWLHSGEVIKDAYSYIADKIQDLSAFKAENNQSRHAYNKENLIKLAVSPLALANKPVVNILIDADSRYQVQIKVSSNKKETYRAARVSFGFDKSMTKEQANELGFFWSDKVDAFKYITPQSSEITIEFKTPANVKWVVIGLQNWQAVGNIELSPTIKVKKIFNDTVESKRVLSLGNSKSHTNIALYGDVNLNILDGSAVWLASLAETLAQSKNCNVFVFLKSPIGSHELVEPLFKLSNVYLIEPNDSIQLRQDKVVEHLRAYETEFFSFDAVIVRGYIVNQLMADSGYFDGRLMPYLTDIPQSEELMTVEDRIKIASICRRSAQVLCQTQEFLDYFNLEFLEAKCTLLPPMLPNEKRN